MKLLRPLKSIQLVEALVMSSVEWYKSFQLRANAQIRQSFLNRQGGANLTPSYSLLRTSILCWLGTLFVWEEIWSRFRHLRLMLQCFTWKYIRNSLWKQLVWQKGSCEFYPPTTWLSSKDSEINRGIAVCTTVWKTDITMMLNILEERLLSGETSMT